MALVRFLLAVGAALKIVANKSSLALENGRFISLEFCISTTEQTGGREPTSEK